MNWKDARNFYPDQWLLLEAIEAHSEAGYRILDRIAVIDTYSDSVIAMRAYGDLHRQDPHRELLVLHTSRENPEIRETHWVGLRGIS